MLVNRRRDCLGCLCKPCLSVQMSAAAQLSGMLDVLFRATGAGQLQKALPPDVYAKLEERAMEDNIAQISDLEGFVRYRTADVCRHTRAGRLSGRLAPCSRAARCSRLPSSPNRGARLCSRCPAPDCGFAMVMENLDDKVFRCQNPDCLQASCRHCGENWEEHFGLRCDEVEGKDEVKRRLKMCVARPACVLCPCVLATRT